MILVTPVMEIVYLTATFDLDVSAILNIESLKYKYFADIADSESRLEIDYRQLIPIPIFSSTGPNRTYPTSIHTYGTVQQVLEPYFPKRIRSIMHPLGAVEL